MSPAPRNDEPLARVGSYELIRLLGEGSMGRVYEARHAKLDRIVAIKLLRAEQSSDANLVHRFFQEARTVNRVNHPHIVEISDFVEDTDEHGKPRAFCVMEYLEGETLTALLARNPLSIERIVRIADQVASALAAAHEVGIVHRDLKPDNIVITRGPDGRDFAKVLDFGVAKLVSPDPGLPMRQTREGAIIGTPRYMSPEQAASVDVDGRADIYGLGCLLYEMLSGRPPFDGTSFGHLMARIITTAPEPLPSTSASREGISPELRTLTLQCLEKDPSARPQTFAEVRARLSSKPHTQVRRRALPGALIATAGLTALALAILALRPQSASVPDAPLLAATLPEAHAGFAPSLPHEVVSPVTIAVSTVVAQEASPAAMTDAPADTVQSRPVSARGVRSKSTNLSRDAVLNPFKR